MADILSTPASLALLVFVLGLKHGLDADHLATIDGLTRFNAGQRPQLARRCGALFSLGHGLVVMAIALLVSLLARQWQTPAWLETFGGWLSVTCLLLLGILNLHAVWRAEPGQLVRPIGLKGRLLGRLAQTSQPGLVMLVGALFALSFDTVSQASLFAVSASQLGGWPYALALSGLFMLGMLVTDGINGLWIAHLLRRADQTALLASRLMGLVVAGLSLLVALFGALKLALPAAAEWSEGKELLFGGSVLAIIAGSFLIARYLSRLPVATASLPD